MLKHLSSLKCHSSFLKKLTVNPKSGFNQKPKNHFSTNDYNQLQDLLSTKLPSVNVSQVKRKQVQSAAMEFGQVITSPNDARKYRSVLTHWGRDKMATILQRILSNTFALIRMLEFQLKSYWNLFSRVQLIILFIGSDNGLVPVRQQAIVWTNDGWLTDAYIQHSASMS